MFGGVKSSHSFIQQEIMRGDLKNYRAQVMTQIKDHGSDIKEVEEQIFLTGAQLTIILEENNKLEEVCASKMLSLRSCLVYSFSVIYLPLN